MGSVFAIIVKNLGLLKIDFWVSKLYVRQRTSDISTNVLPPHETSSVFLIDVQFRFLFHRLCLSNV